MEGSNYNVLRAKDFADVEQLIMKILKQTKQESRQKRFVQPPFHGMDGGHKVPLWVS